MKLFLGRQNYLYNCNDYTGYGYSLTPSAISIGLTTAPDGTSQAIVYYNDTTYWYYFKTATDVLPLTTDYTDAYICSYYIKPFGPNLFRTYLLFSDPSLPAPELRRWAAYIKFDNTEVDSVVAIDNSANGYYPIDAYGYTALDNGWYRLWFAFYPTPHPEGQVCSLYVYPVVYGTTGVSPDSSCAVWGGQIEKTHKRLEPTPLTITDDTNYTSDSDYMCIDITQLPTNIDDIENDMYTYERQLSGTIVETQTFSQNNPKELIWEKIDYIQHSQMLWGLWNAVYSRHKQDCILTYPTYFKTRIKSAVIRIIDFEYNYLALRNHAHVRIKYYVVRNNFV